MPLPDAAARIGLNVHLYPTPFEYATRILKVTRALTVGAIAGRVLVIGTRGKDLPEQERIDDARQVLRIGPAFHGGGPLAKAAWFLTWSWRVFTRLQREPVEMVNCHTLSTLPVSVLLKWWHDAILVYEPHELETETVTSKGVRRRLAKRLERLLVRQARRVIVVSDSIAGQYRRDYELADVPVILNVPELSADRGGPPNRVFRDRFGIPDDHLVFTYQGDLSEPRGVRLLLAAFARTSRDRHLVLMGFGPMEAAVKSAASSHENIHFHPAVPPNAVVEYTGGADVGFALLSDDCLNHRYALPNKLFHYLHAGLPVVVSDLPEMRNLAERYECGWRVAYDSESIAAVVSSIDRNAIERRRPGAARASDELNWGREATKLVAIYRELLPRP